MIQRDTTIARLLEEHPALLDILAAYHPHFGRLRSRMLRRIVAPRVTIARIMETVRELALDEVLALRVPFEPVPLYPVLGKRGLAHWIERTDAEDWLVWFHRAGAAAEAAAPAGPGGDTPA